MQTELDAVNYLLDVLGSPPVDGLETVHPDIATCLNKLKDSSTNIQSTGWWFNNEHSFTITPDADGHIYVPDNTLRVLAFNNPDYIQRGNRVYNTITNSYVFPLAITVDLIVQLPWNELPMQAMQAIKYHAAMQVCSIDLEDSQKAAEQGRLAATAQAQLKAEDLRLERHNILNTPATRLMRAARRPYGRRGVHPYIPGG